MKPEMAIAPGLLAAAVFTVSCSSTGPYGPMTPTGGGERMQHSQRIVVLHKNVADTLLFVNSVQKRLPGGQVLVQANFQNRYETADVWAEVKLEFLDENNMVIDETEWVNTHFPALEVTGVQGNSIHAGAAKHVMLFRNLRTATGLLPKTSGRIFSLLGGTPNLPK